jgi:diamine N-acetyltransferase
MEIIIRNATAEDYDALCEQFEATDALHRANLPQIFQKPQDAAWQYSWYSELISNENAILLVAQAGMQLVGFIHMVMRDSLTVPVFVPRRYAVIEDLGVKSEFRRQGIGRKLISAASEWAIPKGATAVELNAYEFNQEAIAFYRKLGYKTLSRKMIRALNKE